MNGRVLRRMVWVCLLLFPSLCGTAQVVSRIQFDYSGVNITPQKPYLPIRENKLWGYADTNRRVVIQPQFDAANPFFGKYAIVEKNSKAYAINRVGKIVSPGFDQAYQMEDTVLSIYSNEVSDTLGGWGICTITGRKLIPPAYDEVRKVNSLVFGFRKDTLWGFINIDGTLLSEPAFDTAWAYGRDFLMVVKNKKLGVLRNDGKQILANEFIQIYKPNSSFFAAKTKKFWGGVDNLGNALIPYRYDTLQSINSFFIQANIGDSLACYFTKSPGTGTACIYKKFIATTWYWVKLYSFNNTCGLADTNGNITIPVKFKEINPSGCGDWFVQDTAKKWGLYARDGKELLPCVYTRIQPFRGNVTVAFKDNLQSLINSDGEVLVPADNVQINIRGNTIKVLKPDSSAVFYTVNEKGKVIDKSNYEKLRTITIGGTAPMPKAVPVLAQIDTTTGGLLFVPPGDSLDWFFDADKSLWGMRNSYTSEIVIEPQFQQIKRCAGKFTLVEMIDSVNGPLLDSIPTITMFRVGLVCDTTGKLVLQPNYSAINVFDLASLWGFSGCVRATQKDGQQVIVTTDGNETITKFSFVDNCQFGVARVNVGGHFTTDPIGEGLSTLEKFIVAQNLDGRKSFGSAILVKSFLDRTVRIVGGKWGYIDSTGKILIAPQYDAEQRSLAKTGIVKKEKKWGMVDMKNSPILPFDYDWLSYMITNGNYFVQAQNNSIRYGYVDTKGNIIIAADLHQTIAMGGGYIGYNRTGKWGVMNPKGETICIENYQEVLPFYDGYAAVRRGKAWGFIDTLGREITAITYDKVGHFSNGMARVKKGTMWGFINDAGTVVINFKYQNAGDFIGPSAPVKTSTGYGLVSKNDVFLLKPTWLQIVAMEGANFYILKNDYSQGICRPDGKVLVSAKFEGYKYLGEGRIGYRAGLFWGILDTSGRTVTGPVFDKILPFSEKRAAAAKNSLWGYVDRNGRFVIPAQFRSASTFSEHKAYVYVPHQSGCYIDTAGKVLFWLGMDDSGMPFSDGKALILNVDDFKREHYYYLNRRGLTINRFNYDNAKPFKDGAARVCIGKNWGLVSFSGYYLVKPRFFQLDEFDHGIARFQFRSTFGLYSLTGKEILPVQYDVINWNWEVGMIRFEKANSLGYLFPDGRICWPETN